MLVILWIVGALIALVVVALFLLPVFIDTNELVALADEMVGEATGGELRVLGEADFSVFPRLSLNLGEATLTIPPADDTESRIEAKITQLDFGLAILPLLTGRTEVDAMNLSGVNVTITEAVATPEIPVPDDLEDLSDREWEQLGRALRKEREAKRKEMTGATVVSSGLVVAVDAVVLEDVSLTLLDSSGKETLNVAIPLFKVSDVNTEERPITIDGRARLQSPDATPINLSIDGDVRVASNLTDIKVIAVNTRLTGVLSGPIDSTLSGAVTLLPLHADFDLTTALPGGSVSGDLTFAALESPQILVSFESESLNLDQLTPPASSASGKATPVTETEADSSSESAPEGAKPSTAGSTAAASSPATPAPPVPLPVGPLRALDLDLSLGANELIAGGQTITGALLKLRVLDGIADFSQIQGVLHGGQLNTEMVINARRAEVEASIEGGLGGFQIESLLASLDQTDTARGRVDMKWEVETAGQTAQALQVGLDGDLTVEGSNVVVEKVSVQGVMCSAAALINQDQLSHDFGTETALDTVLVEVEFDDGYAEIDPVKLTTAGVSMTGEGRIVLANLDLELELGAKLYEALAEQDEACRIREGYETIKWPVSCEGNLKGDPASWCGLDTDSLAEQVIRNEAKSQLRKQTEKIGSEIGEKAGDVLKGLFGD
ncbi:AsmA family protein [Luminiphilus syltensis NOR5-1B]|uniref:AsmA family protein n=1 Tax=Luminiphilus syltensis NOR5-1B TaxID=565045 RepID=B8KSX5_9GAMM|nr:AsmA family protein [Luminiphilus syltensis]EED34276.1 AsmA family protein [Luminiphilus syltensis NOR5-1B]